MRSKNVSRLTAAFVVTVAGCGGEARPDVNHTPKVEKQVEKRPDGTCFEEFGGNPPGQRDVPCPDSAAAPTTESAEPGK